MDNLTRRKWISIEQRFFWLTFKGMNDKSSARKEKLKLSWSHSSPNLKTSLFFCSPRDFISQLSISLFLNVYCRQIRLATAVDLQITHGGLPKKARVKQATTTTTINKKNRKKSYTWITIVVTFNSILCNWMEQHKRDLVIWQRKKGGERYTNLCVYIPHS